MVDSGIILLKYWLEVSQDEQTRRLQSRIDDPRKIWKLSRHGPEVLQPLVRLLARARRDVRGDRHATGRRGTSRTPNDKKRGRLNIITHLLGQIPYESPKHEDVELPKREKKGDYVEPDLPVRHIPTPF